VKLALTPLKVTEVAPVKSIPSILTPVPTDPVRLKNPMRGGPATWNAPGLIAVPAGVVTVSGPLVAPAGTAAWIEVSVVTVKLALTPLNATAVAPVKFVPSIVTLVPTGALVGARPVIVGVPSTVNAMLLYAVPPGPVTLSPPVTAPAGTTAWICVSEVTAKLALTPLYVDPVNVTAVTPVKLVPLIVTLVPTCPFVGAKLVIVGGGSVT